MMKKKYLLMAALACTVLVLLLWQSQKNTLTSLNEHVRIETPQANELISSPLIIKGEARGTWFFEANFPVILTNWDGLIIAESYAEAEGEWMTENYVPFTATVEFTKPEYGERGTLIFNKANAADLPELDDAVEIPVLFSHTEDGELGEQ